MRIRPTCFPGVLVLHGRVNFSQTKSAIGNRKSEIGNHFAFLPNGNTYGWVQDSFFLIANTERNIGLYKFREDFSLKNNILSAYGSTAESMRSNLLSYIQVGRNVLRENKLYKR